MSARPKVAVLGTGSLGKEHARIYAELAKAGPAEFVGVFDVDTGAARAQASKHGVRAFASVAEAAAASDALSVVTPTTTHFALAQELLTLGKHVLVEKPMTDNAAQAAALVALAQSRGAVLQVGHVERFNPVFSYLEQVATDPRFIECHRLSPFPARSTDIGVVLDLMIHDLDVVLAFVKSPLVAVDAVGIPVLSTSEDIANARLRFANGCVANLTASRISPERLRKIRVFSGGGAAKETSYISLDYRAQEGLHLSAGPRRRERELLAQETVGVKGQLVGERVRRQEDRPGAGAHHEGRTAQAGAGSLHPVRRRTADAEGERCPGEGRVGRRVRDHAADRGRGASGLTPARAG